MNATVRPGTAVDTGAIFEVLDRAFGLRNKPEKQAQARRLAESDAARFLVIEDQGRIVGVAHLARHPLQVGRAVIIKGDVGHVSVLPDLQGRGYGTALMQGVVRFMHDDGFHVSRLGGLMHFYSRFGYEPFLRRYVKIPVAPPHTTLKGIPWSRLYALAPVLAARVRRYDPARDHDTVHALRRRWSRGRSGSPVIPASAGPTPAAGPDANGLEFVYADRRGLRGYLKGALGLVHAGDTSPSLRLDDFAMDCACPEACEALVKTLIAQAAQRAPTEIIARLPYDERLFAALTAGGIAFELQEMHQAADGNMMQVIHLPALLRAVAPELGRRLQAVGACFWEGLLRLQMPRQSAVLEVRGARARVWLRAEPDVTVTTDHATFLKWLFGIQGAAEFALPREGRAPAVDRLLAALFPREPCASGPWG